MNQYDPNNPFRPEHNIVTNSPLNPNHPSSAAHQKKSHKLRTGIIIGVVALLGMGGCSAILGNALKSDAPTQVTAGAGKTAPAVPETTPTFPVVTTPPAVVEPTPSEPAETGIGKVGAKDWFTYEDGLQVQVTGLKKYKISSSAAGNLPGQVGVIATVTIKNGSGETFDANLVDVKLAAGPNGVETDQVYDSAKGVGGGFEGSIPKGRSKTAKVAFGVSPAHLSKLVVEVAPSWDHEASFFEGSVR